MNNNEMQFKYVFRYSLVQLIIDKAIIEVY